MKCKWLALMLVGGLAFAGGMHLRQVTAQGVPCNWTGVWSTNFEEMRLYEVDNLVNGIYYFEGGEIAGGKENEKLLVGDWTQDGNETGRFQFFISDDCRSFSGSWYVNNVLGGEWNGTRIETLTEADIILRVHKPGLIINDRALTPDFPLPLLGTEIIRQERCPTTGCTSIQASLNLVCRVTSDMPSLFEYTILSDLERQEEMQSSEFLDILTDVALQQDNLIESADSFCNPTNHSLHTAQNDGPEMDILLDQGVGNFRLLDNAELGYPGLPEMNLLVRTPVASIGLNGQDSVVVAHHPTELFSFVLIQRGSVEIIDSKGSSTEGQEGQRFGINADGITRLDVELSDQLYLPLIATP